MKVDPAGFFALVTRSIKDAIVKGPIIESTVGMGDGLSGSLTVAALQRTMMNFADDSNACYVEIGVYHGMSLLSVALHNPGNACFGIDDFSQLDEDGINFKVVNDRIAESKAANVTLINMDFEDAMSQLEEKLNGRKIGLYFIDGAHDYRSQLMCLMLALPHLHERAVIFIDDANYRFVRQSTEDFLVTHPTFKMIFEAYTPGHPAQMSREDADQWAANWLMGVNVLVRDPENLLPPMYPSTDRSRTLFVNDWDVHRTELAELAPDSLRLVQAICHGWTDKEQELREQVLNKYNSMRDLFKDRDPDRNTYTRGLSNGKFNELTPTH